MPQEGEAVSSVGGDLLIGVLFDGGKEYFEELLNPVIIPSTEDAEAEDWGLCHPPSQSHQGS